MPSLIKQLIWNLTDFEFLASISQVDFHNRKIFVKRHFWNTLIKKISDQVHLESEKDIRKVITTIKRLYETRLGLVNAHSMKRYFLNNIKIAFASFSRHIDSFFKKVRAEEREKETSIVRSQKREKRKRHRRNKKNKNKPVITLKETNNMEQDVVALADTNNPTMDALSDTVENLNIDQNDEMESVVSEPEFEDDLIESSRNEEEFPQSDIQYEDITIEQFMEENFSDRSHNSTPPPEVLNPEQPNGSYLVPDDDRTDDNIRLEMRRLERVAAVETVENRPYEYDNNDPLFTEIVQQENIDRIRLRQPMRLNDDRRPIVMRKRGTGGIYKYSSNNRRKR